MWRMAILGSMQRGKKTTLGKGSFSKRVRNWLQLSGLFSSCLRADAAANGHFNAPSTHILKWLSCSARRRRAASLCIQTDVSRTSGVECTSLFSCPGCVWDCLRIMCKWVWCICMHQTHGEREIERNRCVPCIHLCENTDLKLSDLLLFFTCTHYLISLFLYPCLTHIHNYTQRECWSGGATNGENPPQVWPTYILNDVFCCLYLCLCFCSAI